MLFYALFIYIIKCQFSNFQPNIYHLFYGDAAVQRKEVITREIYLSQPVVTNRFRVVVRKAADIVVFKLDVIGMPPDKKYDTDPVLKPQTFQECK